MNNTTKQLEKFKERVLCMLEGIPDIHKMMVNPSTFSDDPSDNERMDCDVCPSSQSNASDCYDPNVCRECWRNAIKKYTPKV